MTNPSTPSGYALTLLTGPQGIGRSRALRTVRDTATAAGRPVLEVRLSPEDRHDPWYLAGRLLAALPPPPARLPPARLAAGRARTAAAEPPAAALTRSLREHPGLTVLVDDVQWADPESVTALLGALPDLARTPVHWVATLRTGPQPAPGPAAAFERLRADGLARAEPLRPLSPAESDALLFRLLGATPNDSLRTVLRRFSRGRPAALIAAVEGYRDLVRVVDRRAYLTDPTAAPRLPDGHGLLRPVQDLPPVTRAVARALAVLEALEADVPALIGSALDLEVADVRAHLGTLRDEGLARQDARGWRIATAPLAVALTGALGPFERRRLARIAVQAIYRGEATCGHPGFLPDQVTIAGTLLDREPARLLLRGHAIAATGRTPEAAARWWAGVARLSDDPGDRAEAEQARAVADLLLGRYDATRAAMRRQLADHAVLSPMFRQEAEQLALIGARAARDADEVRRTARGEPGWPGGPEPTPVTRATALVLLNRWSEAARVRSGAAPSLAAENLGAQIETVTTGRSVAGRAPGPHGTDAPPAWTRRNQAGTAMIRFRIAAIAGDLDGAERVVAAADLTVDVLSPPDLALHRWRTGRWDEALEDARFSIATDLTQVFHPSQSTLHRVAAEVLLARGRPARARVLLENARADTAPLPHLLAPVEAELAWILGDPATAARTAGDALAEAAEQGVAIGVDELRLAATELAMARGDARAAKETALAMPAPDSTAGELRAATASLIAHRDAARAGAVLALARRIGQPYELARTIERVVRWTGHRPELLGEAYDLLGALGAILHRSRIRQAMRDHGVTVPGRAETLAESEQLLATLVAEGLSNRELAAATQSSEKSVEGRLSRLFTRTGLRSRVELAAAVLSGEFRLQ
ncbi:DNA-binding NarL/FixJ family response regulator [Catenuloplanes nepalensis]|uniref:DNA-binding NarL/FixJ family response regulator n=1 Tax=Catenuloplanes nepalensis TaxID=587533 RepID=A0ABT9MYI1_9ACTN|nr:helix-turn-helix transcriptional regulator [Catenuloplanes nepalensis]MDP9796101.1 DNA-binding NarL/FixJ family response regulator [Catenuloplanes nepalensis]